MTAIAGMLWWFGRRKLEQLLETYNCKGFLLLLILLAMDQLSHSSVSGPEPAMVSTVASLSYQMQRN